MRRRTFFGIAGAAALGSGLSAACSSAPAAPVRDQRIDVHQHVIPPRYRAWLDERGVNAAGGYPLPKWSPSSADELMDSQRIATGMLSVSTPGVSIGDFGSAAVRTAAAAQAREVNEFVAEMVRDRPGRFGLLATLPLPDVDGALTETAYAFDTLKADGVILLANVQGTYLGDPRFDPLLEELNRRRATILLHPSSLPGGAADGVPPFLADFLLDTVRAALHLTISGAMDRFPQLNIVLAHAGGFLPYIAYRTAPFLRTLAKPDLDSAQVDANAAMLKRFWFDVALSSSASSLPSLVEFADPRKIVYGSDSPFAPDQMVEFMATSLDEAKLPQDAARAIDRGNAERLFPRLAKS